MNKQTYTNEQLREMLEASIEREMKLGLALGTALDFLPPHGQKCVAAVLSGGSK